MQLAGDLPLLLRDFLLFSGNAGVSYVSITARMGHYRSEKSFTLLICVIRVNQWQIKLLATDFADYTNPIVPVFAGLASCFSTDQKKLKRLQKVTETSHVGDKYFRYSPQRTENNRLFDISSGSDQNFLILMDSVVFKRCRKKGFFILYVLAPSRLCVPLI